MKKKVGIIRFHSLQQTKYKCMELQHSLGDKIFRVNLLNQFIECLCQWALLRGRFNHLPNAVAYWPE